MLKSSLLSLMFTVVVLGQSAQAPAQEHYPFQNRNLPAEQRIDNLVSLLSLQEKIDLLGKTLNVPRLGIHASGALPSPLGSNGQFEGLHGVAMDKAWARKSPGGSGEYSGITPIPTTQFPQAAGLGETWDPALLQQAAAEEGYEARYIFQSYDRGGLIIRAPNADLARDPRWGRSEESYGEDPYLVGTMAVAFVKGLQGDTPGCWQTISLLKHFMANSNEDKRTSSSSDFDAALMHEYYAAPFRMGIEQGGADALMTAYNAVNGIPMATSPLLKSLAMKRWGLNGMIDTDRGAVTDMVTRHKYYPDMDHAVAGAIKAGVNQFLNPYEPYIENALREHLISEADINENLKGVFRVLLRLGALDAPDTCPYTNIKEGKVPTPWETQKSKALALRVTEESIVLLKNAPAGNAAPLLPLDVAKLRSIAVVGPRADEVDADGYGGMPPFGITPLQGIKEKVGAGATVKYSADHDQAVQMAKTSDVAIVVIGNQPVCGARFGRCPDPTEGKEAIDRKRIHLNPEQQKLVEDVYAANPHTVVVLVSGFPFTIDWEQEHVPVIVHMAHSSEEEGAALADVLFGDYDPAGRVSVTWPQSISQLPPMMDYNIRDGRTYMYFKGKPLYPFGYGLSYTSFKYSDLRVSHARLHENGRVEVSVKVTNTGKRSGDEVVQMYVRHMDAKPQGPSEELKGFQRIHLAAGETKTVSLPLSAKSLAHWDDAGKGWKIESGRVRVMIGSSSTDIRAEKTISVGK